MPRVAVNDKASLETAIRGSQMVPLWNTGALIGSKHPRSRCTPSVWSYADTKSMLLSAAELVPAREAERRAVLFINPGRAESPYTLDTLLAAHQLILPGEKAICHRHSPFAVRFLIEGEQGYTAISGKKMYMYPGDLIITPVWNWHDHGNEGDKNVIWMDGLNIPLFRSMPIDFTEHYDEEFGRDTHESSPCPDEDAADMKFSWTQMQARLQAEGGDYATIEYQLPGTGDSVSTTIAANMERIEPGTVSAPRKETTNHIFQVHKGSGTTELVAPDGARTTLAWGVGDNFCVPSWYEFTNRATDSGETVYLFYFTDKPMQEKLGLWRTA
ncbi:RmlC-like cupin [Aspergillus cavernicola]|uniref:RmlC-like cupin n=1 Tax=Aspergillus cavernicola TaxID=176166 RepID=A0ABR4J134_9EURO